MPTVLLLCDQDSVNRPELDKIRSNETILTIKKTTIQDFTADFKKNPSQYDSNFICVLSITPNLKESDDFKKDLKCLFDLFDRSEKLLIYKDKEGSLSEFKYELLNDEGFQLLLESTNKLFNNAKLSFEEQLLIKKFIGSAPAVIDYNVLKPGASGSGVIEVQANFLMTQDSKRYVIKISKKQKDKPSKLKVELKNFKDCIAHFSEANYSADYEEIEMLEAIKYNYASTDSLSASDSFFDLIENFLTGKGVTLSDLDSIILKLFTGRIFKSWNTPSTHTSKVLELYQSYLKTEPGIYEAIEEIKNYKSKTEVLGSDVVRFYNTLKDHQLETNKKYCHGDLHSENFFWDNASVILIDFGYTGRHHAVIDHSFLEISIRLRHFPRYIPIDELMRYEEQFLGVESFEPGMNLDFVRRPRMKELYKLINTIRIDAKQYCHNKADVRKEYFVSLFIISFRLCQYKDLNQLYSFAMAEMFSRKIQLT